MAVYLDMAATTPIDPRVRSVVLRYMDEDFGNAGSRTHGYGTRARSAVEAARDQVAVAVAADPSEVIFTSGATESNNIAILGLADLGRSTGRKHVLSTAIEHKSVLGPLDHLASRGFDVELVAPTQGGWVEPDAILERLRPDTLLVSMMHVNNETGVKQPILEVAQLMQSHDAYLHVDAAQSFGKVPEPLLSQRIDLISVSGHKLFAPKGVGALIVRRRNGKRVPLKPLMFGGGQERGLRPGTLPVHLIAGLGEAATLALAEVRERSARCSGFRETLLSNLTQFDPIINGSAEACVPNIVSLSFRGVDSEALMIALGDLVAVSNGSACTSTDYAPSHVLQAMGLDASRVEGAVRFSWSHQTPQPNWHALTKLLDELVPRDTGAALLPTRIPTESLHDR